MKNCPIFLKLGVINRIIKLPEDIKLKIYKEYFECIIYYDEYIKKIKDDRSIKLNGTLLRPLILLYNYNII